MPLLSDIVPPPVMLPQPIVPTVIFGEPDKPVALPVQDPEEPVVFWLSVGILAAASVPEDIFEAFVVSVVAEATRPSTALA